MKQNALSLNLVHESVTAVAQLMRLLQLIVKVVNMSWQLNAI